MPSGLLYLYSLDWSITRRRGLWFVFIIAIQSPVFNANSVDPDQTPQNQPPRSAASDLGLHCLPVPLLWH